MKLLSVFTRGSCTILLFISLTFSAIAQPSFSSHFARQLQAQQWQILDSIHGAGFFKKQYNRDTLSFTAYLQVIDMRQMQVKQFTEATANTGTREGKYWRQPPGNSPYYKRLSSEAVLALAKRDFDQRFFSITNGVFFEEYNDSTQLSFPIKVDGKVLSAGSSPYGPIKNPANEYYRHIQLKALIFKDNTVVISNYQTTNGNPLNSPLVSNAIVTYSYQNHPAKVLANNRVNRYHVLGTLNADGKPGDEVLLMLTTDPSNLDDAAVILKQLGVKSDILVVDGGTSVFVNNRAAGTVEYPAPIDPLYKNEHIRLPHYLVFVSKK